MTNNKTLVLKERKYGGENYLNSSLVRPDTVTLYYTRQFIMSGHTAVWK